MADHITFDVLIGLCGWTLCLLMLMEGLRTRLVATGRIASNMFQPDNTNLSPFMQRLARAHANWSRTCRCSADCCLRQSSLAGPRSPTRWPRGCWPRASSSPDVHLASLSTLAVNIRFLAFAVQLAICVYWVCQLFVV